MNCIQNVKHRQYRHTHVQVDITPVPDRGFVLCAILGLLIKSEYTLVHVYVCNIITQLGS